MLSTSAVTAVLGISFVLYELVGLLRNVRIAKSTGLPYTISPHLEFETIAYITTPILRYLYSGYLMKGQGWPKWARFMIKDWPYEDKRRAHQDYGDIFLVAGPHGLICYSADATMAMDVCTRRKEFIKPRVCYPLTDDLAGWISRC